MPHAASLQSFLDTCSQGHFDNSSAWVPLHAHCRHVVPQEHAGRHIAPNDPGAASCHQRLPFVRRVTGPKADFPGASYEAQVVGRGNALLDAYARNQSGGGPVLYVNRSAPIAGAAAVAGAPAMIESPCFHSHPYGALTDVSVCLVLRAVQGLAHGPGMR